MVDFIRVKNRLILIPLIVALNLVMPMAFCMPDITDNSDEILKQGESIKAQTDDIKNQLSHADEKISDLQKEVDTFKTKEKTHFAIAIIVAILVGISGWLLGHFFK